MSLATRSAHGIAVKHQLQVITVRATGGVAQDEIALTGRCQMMGHRAVVQVALVFHFHGLVITGDGIVVMHEDGQELLDPLAAALVYQGRLLSHHLLYRLIE